MVGPVASDVRSSEIPGGAKGIEIGIGRGQGRRILAAGALLALAVLIGATGLIGSNAWVAWQSRGSAYQSVATIPARSVAIVPGSRVHDGRPLRIVRARLEAALALYQAGRVKAILVSGQDSAAAPEATVMAGWLRARGVPERDIWSDAGGSRTRETMNRAGALFGVTDAIVCTQTVNMARSLYLARAAGIDAVGLALPTDLERSTRYMATESLKTTLAFAESALLPRPATSPSLVATR